MLMQILIIKLQNQLKMLHQRKLMRSQENKQKLRSIAGKQRCGHPQRSVPTLWLLLQMIGNHCHSEGTRMSWSLLRQGSMRLL